VTKVLGFHVPQLIRVDDDLHAIRNDHCHPPVRARFRRCLSR
jgi:hypothetical protein